MHNGQHGCRMLNMRARAHAHTHEKSNCIRYSRKAKLLHRKYFCFSLVWCLCVRLPDVDCVVSYQIHISAVQNSACARKRRAHIALCASSVCARMASHTLRVCITAAAHSKLQRKPISGTVYESVGQICAANIDQHRLGTFMRTRN